MAKKYVVSYKIGQPSIFNAIIEFDSLEELDEWCLIMINETGKVPFFISWIEDSDE